jgi:hypothetical protein
MHSNAIRTCLPTDKKQMKKYRLPVKGRGTLVTCKLHIISLSNSTKFDFEIHCMKKKLMETNNVSHA